MIGKADTRISQFRIKMHFVAICSPILDILIRVYRLLDNRLKPYIWRSIYIPTVLESTALEKPARRVIV